MSKELKNCLGFRLIPRQLTAASSDSDVKYKSCEKSFGTLTKVCQNHTPKNGLDARVQNVDLISTDEKRKSSLTSADFKIYINF